MVRMVSRVLVLILMGGLVACSDTPEVVDDDPKAESAVEAVEMLIGFFQEPDFDSAAYLAVPGQAALAALAEGASFADVADALREGDHQVAANFWAGFAQGTGAYLSGEVDMEAAPPVRGTGVDFGVVLLNPPDLGLRPIYTQDLDGHRIDLLASFGGGLAEQMVAPVERLLTARTEDSALILAELKKAVPSLLMGSTQEWLAPTERLSLVRLVELITR